MDAYCRLCSSRKSPLINIFSKTSVDHKFTEKISQRLHLFVSQDDILSKSVCCNCCGKLDIFDNFVSEVHRTQIDLQKRTMDLLNRTKLVNRKTLEPDMIESDDDAKSLAICYNSHCQISENESSGSVIKRKDKTKLFNVSSTSSKKTSLYAETNQSKAKRKKYDDSNSSGENSDDAKASHKKSKQRLERKSIEISKADFAAQTGNSLLSDLKGLKNSLLLRRISTKDVLVLTIPVPAIPNQFTKKCFVNSTTNKGCQTEILLGVKSDSRIIYQNIDFEGRSLLEVSNENNAVITSDLSV